MMTTYTVIHDVMNPYNGLGALLKNISVPKVLLVGILCLFCDFISIFFCQFKRFMYLRTNFLKMQQ